MDGPSGGDSDPDDREWAGGDDGSPGEDPDGNRFGRDDEDDRFRRVEDPAAGSDRPGATDPERATQATEPGPGSTESGVLGVDWSPRDEDVTLLDRVRAVAVAIGLGIAGFVVAFFLYQVAGVVLLLAGIDPTELTFVGQLILGFLLLQGMSFPIVAVAYLGYRRRSLSYLRVGIPSLRDLAWIVGGFFLVMALLTSVLVVYSAIDAPQAERTDSQELRENPTAILLMIPASILLIGPAEELLFRGVIQTRLRETFGPVGAIVFANAAFAPLHVFALTGSLAALAFTIGGLFVPGMVFGTVYEITDNLVVPAAIHGLYNTVIFLSLYGSTTAVLLFA